MSGFVGRLIVTFVLLLISFIAYSSQIFIIWPWYGRALSVELIILLLPFNLLVGMLLWNYFLCLTVDPGRVPPAWKPDTHSDGFEVKKLTGKPRYCRMCQSFKPPRTHHCRQCNHCVLRMGMIHIPACISSFEFLLQDHHCPWIDNCVGHYTHGHFVRFLFYVDVACSYHLAMMARRVYQNLNVNYWDSMPAVEFVLIILNLVACIPVLLSVGAFSIYHFNGLMNNTTTIEGWEKDKVATMHLGRRRNIESVLGSNPWFWCWPTRTPGNGFRYELTEGEGVLVELSTIREEYEREEDSEEQVQGSWPPDDPTRPYFEEAEGEFKLADSPWTFENDGVNPDLQPSNTKLRKDSFTRRRKARDAAGYSTHPPYHPDYQGSEDAVSSSEDDQNHRLERIRKGSEGLEFKPADREEMMLRYLEQIGETPGRYQRYIPQVESESENEEDDVLLGPQKGVGRQIDIHRT
ncbi:hypothetical protein D9757_004693 [Collybiopsis confluens]|uniref:Palmitoyltransferase n=1 Tax=Collybiopsis confluens TaxID=2823264 RepID=A0A8H5HSN4_9AGAR|nr:hypothetical protein D9757_004693 [Collybiopsis confluens]